MTLLNATLLFGALAAVVPLALHLMSRQQPKRVLLPSVRFLTQQLATQTSRLRVRRWWLLFLRMLILGLIAIVLAGPAIGSATVASWATVAGLMIAGLGVAAIASVAWVRGLGRSMTWVLAGVSTLCILTAGVFSIRLLATSETVSLAQSAPIAAVVLMDNSPVSTRRIESTASETDAQNRFDLIRTTARSVLGRLPAGSRVAVTDRSTVPLSFSLDESTAKDRINQIAPLAAPQPIAERLDAAAELLRGSDLPDRQIIVVSDLVETAWKPLPNTAPAWLRKTDTEDEVAPIGLTIINPIGKDRSGPVINRAVLIPRLVDAPPAQGVPVSVVVPVAVEANANSQQSISIAIDLSLFERELGLPVIRDGKSVLPTLKSVDRTSVSVKPGEQVEVTLTLPPMTLGTHHAVVRIIGDDAMAWDDVRYLTIMIPPPRRVLIAGESIDEANRFSLAMTAPRSIDDPAAGYRIDRVGLEDLSVVSMSDYKVVVLIDPAISALGESTVSALESFVQSGGRLWVLLGPAAEANDSSTFLWPRFVRSWRVPEPGTFLEIQSPNHPVFGPLNQLSPRASWGEFRIHRYWQTATQDTATQDNDSYEEWSVLAKYAGTDHAAIMVRKQVLVTTTPLPALAGNRRDWNELFQASDPWPAFVLVRGVMGWMSGVNDQDLTVTASQPAVVTLPDTIDAAPEPLKLQLFAPQTNSPQPVLAPRNVLTLDDTHVPGTYFLRGDGIWSGYSSNLAELWSLDKPLDAPEMATWLGEEGWQSISDVDELTFIAGSGRQAVPLHGPLMLLSVFVFLGELLLSNHFYRGSSDGVDR